MLAAMLSLPGVAAASAPVRFHLRASYLDAHGATHALEVWRDGDRLRRDTDGKLSLFVTHARGGEDRYRVVDRGRKLAYDVSRTNLYRIGTFTDWGTLTTLVPRDRTLVGDGVGATPVGTCRWQVAGDKRICWSERWGLPLRVEEKKDAAWRAVLTVEELRAGRPAAEVWAAPADVTPIDVDRDVAPTD